MNDTENLKQFYAALNSNDIPTIMGLLDPQILRVEFEGSPSSGTYRGLKELEDHFIRGRSTWAEGGCEPESFTVFGSKIIVSVSVRVRLKEKKDWIDGRVFDGFNFKDGKILEFRSFFKEEDALRWANM